MEKQGRPGSFKKERRRSSGGKALHERASGRKKSRHASISNTPPQSPMSPRSPLPGRKKARNAASPITPPISPFGVQRPVGHRRNSLADKMQNGNPRSPQPERRPRDPSSERLQHGHELPRSPQLGRRQRSSERLQQSHGSPRASLNRQRARSSERLQHGKQGLSKRVPSSERLQQSHGIPRASLNRQRSRSSEGLQHGKQGLSQRVPSSERPQQSHGIPRASRNRQRSRSSERLQHGKQGLSQRVPSSERPQQSHGRPSQHSDGGRGHSQPPQGGRGQGPGGRGGRRPRPATIGFRVGQFVRFENLKTKDMNGKEGYVYGITWDRVHITIRDEVGVDYVAIQPKNLRVLAQPQKSTTKPAGPDWDQYQRDIQESKNTAIVSTDEAKKTAALQDEDDDEESVTQREEEEDDEFETEEERRASQEKLLKGLEELGLSPDLLCDSADDALSAITISAQSYVLDLYVQKENREQAHTQEVIEEAYGLYTIALKNEGIEENETLFMEIFYKLKAEKETIFKEQDAIVDKCLEFELDKLLEKQEAEAKGDEQEEDDFVYDEEEMYPEIGKYEPIVRIPEPKPKPKATKKEKLSQSAPAEESPELSKPDQIPTEEVDTGCDCACSIM